MLERYDEFRVLVARLSALESSERYPARRKPRVETITVKSPSAQATRTGDLLVRLDRELRRVPPLVSPPRRPNSERLADSSFQRSLPRPISVDDTGLRLVRAEAGSFSIVSEPFGVLLSILNSQPLTAIATLDALWNISHRIWHWTFGRRHDEDDQGQIQGEPNGEMTIGSLSDWEELAHELGTAGIAHGRRFRIRGTSLTGEQIDFDFRY